jgi:hypothetical protein
MNVNYMDKKYKITITKWTNAQNKTEKQTERKQKHPIVKNILKKLVQETNGKIV